MLPQVALLNFFHTSARRLQAAAAARGCAFAPLAASRGCRAGSAPQKKPNFCSKSEPTQLQPGLSRVECHIPKCYSFSMFVNLCRRLRPRRRAPAAARSCSNAAFLCCISVRRHAVARLGAALAPRLHRATHRRPLCRRLFRRRCPPSPSKHRHCAPSYACQVYVASLHLFKPHAARCRSRLYPTRGPGLRCAHRLLQRRPRRNPVENEASLPQLRGRCLLLTFPSLDACPLLLLPLLQWLGTCFPACPLPRYAQEALRQRPRSCSTHDGDAVPAVAGRLAARPVHCEYYPCALGSLTQSDASKSTGACFSFLFEHTVLVCVASASAVV